MSLDLTRRRLVLFGGKATLIETRGCIQTNAMEEMMKKMFLGCMATAMLLGQPQTGVAASDKCTVIEVKGKRMVLDCEQRTKGFSEGSRIKIKTDTSQRVEGR